MVWIEQRVAKALEGKSPFSDRLRPAPCGDSKNSDPALITNQLFLVNYLGAVYL